MKGRIKNSGHKMPWDLLVRQCYVYILSQLVNSNIVNHCNV